MLNAVETNNNVTVNELVDVDKTLKYDNYIEYAAANSTKKVSEVLVDIMDTTNSDEFHKIFPILQQRYEKNPNDALKLPDEVKEAISGAANHAAIMLKDEDSCDKFVDFVNKNPQFVKQMADLDKNQAVDTTIISPSAEMSGTAVNPKTSSKGKS